MGKMNKKMFDKLFTILIIIGLFYFGFKHRKERRIYRTNLIENASYTIGTVSYYSSGKNPIVVPGLVNSTGSSPIVEYEFMIGDSSIKNKYDAFIAKVPDEGIKVGEKYLVLYNTNIPEENRMFFDYPIKDSTDYYQHIKEFEAKRN